jgi:hypothetical protein
MAAVEAENATAGNGDTTAENADFHSTSEFWRDKKMVLITPSKTKIRRRKKTRTSSRRKERQFVVLQAQMELLSEKDVEPEKTNAHMSHRIRDSGQEFVALKENQTAQGGHSGR